MYWLILTLFQIITLALALVLCFPFLLQLAALLKSKAGARSPSLKVQEDSIAIIITAYKNLEICTDLLKSIRQQDYVHFKCFVVADRCEANNRLISDEKIKYLFPKQALNSKVKSIAYALENGADNFTQLLILDPDNELEVGFLGKIMSRKASDVKIIQGNRLPKNLDTPTACLDAAGEFFRNRMDREVPSILNISATISGSGFIVETAFYQNFLHKTKILERAYSGEIITGEDKELQNFVVEEGFKTAYASHAILYDQKIKLSQQIERQRARWLSAYFHALPNVLDNISKAMFALEWKKMLFFIISAYPPIFLLAAASVSVLLLSLLLNTSAFSLLIFFSGLAFLINYIAALHFSRMPKKIWKAFLSLPHFIFKMSVGVSHIPKTKKDFLPTDHGK